jgi:hypothetical protein
MMMMIIIIITTLRLLLCSLVRVMLYQSPCFQFTLYCLSYNMPISCWNKFFVSLSLESVINGSRGGMNQGCVIRSELHYEQQLYCLCRGRESQKEATGRRRHMWNMSVHTIDSCEIKFKLLIVFNTLLPLQHILSYLPRVWVLWVCCEWVWG